MTVTINSTHKLTAITVIVDGKTYSRFVNLPATQRTVTEAQLASLFPALKSLPRGCTYTVR